MCEINNIENGLKQDVMKISKILNDQNYFCFQDTTYIQTEGLAMGNPTSSIFSEFCLQYVENTEICSLLLKHQVEGYFHYVVDILIMYKEDRTNINVTFDSFNKLMRKMK